ncbi:MAG: DinB family protein [Acidobacteriota bacterium]|nr:DinB family protein [Acidobacteriota bacterium]
MKRARLRLLVSISMMLALRVNAKAQEAKPAEAPASTAPVANPVSSTVKQQLTRYTKIMVAAAEAMPAEKYNFKPTPEMNTFAHLTMHIAQGNTGLCSKISGTAAPETAKLSETDPKDKLVAGLKASFDFCATALANVDDSKLSDPMTLFGSFPSSRAGALIALSDGFSDHYGAQAIYLRLNGILPPTAKLKP